MRSLLLLAIGCSTHEPTFCPVGDPTAAAALDIIHLDDRYEPHTTTAYARVPLFLPQQGGWAARLGARATNIDGCHVDATTSFRDLDSAQVAKVDQRPTLLDDLGDGWGITPATAISELQFCPQPAATRDLHDEPYEVTVELVDLNGQHAAQSIVIVPVCDDDPTGRCLCMCARDYVIGSPCY